MGIYGVVIKKGGGQTETFISTSEMVVKNYGAGSEDSGHEVLFYYHRPHNALLVHNMPVMDADWYYDIIMKAPKMKNEGATKGRKIKRRK